MEFKRTDNTIKNHTSIKSKELGFYKTGDKYKEVVFLSKDNVYFNAYGTENKNVDIFFDMAESLYQN